MIKLGKLAVAAFVAAAALSGAKSANADSLNFSTTAVFDTTLAAVGADSTALNASTSFGGGTLSFTGVTGATGNIAPGLPLTAQQLTTIGDLAGLGSFTLSGLTAVQSPFTEYFKVAINQTLPTSGTNSSIATLLFGSITLNQGNGGAEIEVFSPAPVPVGAGAGVVNYSPFDTLVPNSGSPVVLDAYVEEPVGSTPSVATPLPSSAFAGLGLLGVLGLGSLRRKSIA